jgi:hypothetical protein
MHHKGDSNGDNDSQQEQERQKQRQQELQRNNGEKHFSKPVLHLMQTSKSRR